MPARTARTAAARTIAAALGIVLLAGCARHVPLSATHREALAGERTIHAVHYPAPALDFRPAPGPAAPAPARLERGLGGDPAAPLSQGLARLIGKKQRLRNIRVEPRALAAPVPKDTGGLGARFRDALVLETWVERWSLTPARGADKGYVLGLQARARLSRADRGEVLWLSRPCRVGNDSHNTGLTARDLASDRRLAAAAGAAREECVRQLVRDFFAEDNARRQ